jgi:hypothetical protein
MIRDMKKQPSAGRRTVALVSLLQTHSFSVALSSSPGACHVSYFTSGMVSRLCAMPNASVWYFVTVSCKEERA